MNTILVHKAYKFRTCPDQKQEIVIVKTIGCLRYIYNYFLNLLNDTYINTSKSFSYNTCSTMLPKIKRNEETIWLSEVDSMALQSSLKNLFDAFSR